MSVPVTLTLAVALLGVMALATLELFNARWQYSRGRGLHLGTGGPRSRMSVGLSLLIFAAFSAAPQVVMTLTLFDPTQPLLSRIIAAVEVVVVIGWLGLLVRRIARKSQPPG